jgi:hypothetical protein
VPESECGLAYFCAPGLTLPARCPSLPLSPSALAPPQAERPGGPGWRFRPDLPQRLRQVQQQLHLHHLPRLPQQQGQTAQAHVENDQKKEGGTGGGSRHGRGRIGWRGAGHGLIVRGGVAVAVARRGSRVAIALAVRSLNSPQSLSTRAAAAGRAEPTPRRQSFLVRLPSLASLLSFSLPSLSLRCTILALWLLSLLHLCILAAACRSSSCPL